MLFVSWGERDLLNSPYTVMVKEFGEMGNSASASQSAYHMSSYNTQQRRSSGEIPIPPTSSLLHQCSLIHSHVSSICRSN